MRFKVLRGCHAEGKRVYQRGEVVTTDVDLAKRFNSPGSIKFQQLPDDSPVQQAAEAGYDSADEPSVVQLEAYTVKQLRDLADSNDVDLVGFTKKEEIINALREAQVGE